MTEKSSTPQGERIVGVLRDKAVADRMIRALIHKGFEPERVVLMVSGVTEYAFGAHEPGVKIIRFPELTTTGTFAIDQATDQEQAMLDLGIPESGIRQYEQLLMDGDVLIGVTCAGRCDVAKSLFLDAGSSQIFTPDNMGGMPIEMPAPGPEATRTDVTDRPDMMAGPREDRGSGLTLKDNPYDDRWDLEHRPDEGGLLEDKPYRRPTDEERRR